MAKSRQVMVIEDDECILESLKDLLESENFKVICAKNGKQALDALGSSSELPALILLDLMMPVMDGLQFRQAQISDPRLSPIPVVIMSAGSLNQDRACMVGIKNFLKKPLDIDSIVRVVHLEVPTSP